MPFTCGQPGSEGEEATEGQEVEEDQDPGGLDGGGTFQADQSLSGGDRVTAAEVGRWRVTWECIRKGALRHWVCQDDEGLGHGQGCSDPGIGEPASAFRGTKI